ncbi:hypothetical protein AX17_003493 [Amanita inopinata Kibby_2008]|nr:hypothetical protein AX17_003493 [Amanita inopinata Kibby_2008]
MKRRYTVDSGDEDPNLEQPEELSKRPRTQPHRSRATTDSADEHAAEELEVDVEGNDSDTRSHAASLTSKKAASARLGKLRTKQSTETLPPQRKKRPVVVSEPDSEDEYVDVGGVKGKASAKASASNRQTKGKAKSDAVDPIKDERKRVATRVGAAHTETVGSAAKRPRLRVNAKVEDGPVVDAGGGDGVITPETPGANPVHSPSSVKEEAPPPPKKRKLPTIKKNKPATSSGPATPSTTSTVAKPGPAAVPRNTNLEGGVLPLTTNTRKSAATAGHTDFDLRNQDVYNELFKNTGGSTPRSGLSRREKNEERRRELNKMRDEARARRELEAKHAFDLQGQVEKITRFEERLRRERNSALWPNAMAAKWREIWERERRKTKEREIQDGGQRGEAREEGEMPEGEHPHR